jgi:branched-chain amino acid transport system substrate-binding protein
MHGFELQLLPVTAPGVEQKATWLQVRQSRPTTCCCGAGA